MNACVYYENRTNQILDILPKETDNKLKSKIYEVWGNEINKKVLITLSMFDELSISELKRLVGHSISTIHDSVSKLESDGLIESEITYVNNKKKMLRPKIIFITKNPRFKIAFQKFFQGIWIDSKKTNKIIEFLGKYNKKYFTTEEISSKLKIPVDEVEILMSNWESPATRTLSNFLKERPFEKKVLYKGRE